MGNRNSLESLAIVQFSICGWQAGIEAQHVRDSHAQPKSDQPEVMSKLLGFTGQHPNPDKFPQYLTLKHKSSGNQEVEVDGPTELLHLPVATIHPLPPLLAARTQLLGLRALALTDSKLTLLFEIS
ncbi:MAG: hypothetical protein WC742_14385 [Gallionellaceae bacterium]|jgi:hypothetical protein